MLGKLIKYDFKWINRNLIIFYILSLMFAIATRLFFQIEESLLFNIIANICSGALLSLLFSVLFNVIIRSWARFIDNVYKDEGYLTGTLPVKRSHIYLSKAITSFLHLVMAFAFILLMVFIAYYSKENFETLKNFFIGTANVMNTSTTGLITVTLITIFLELYFIILIGYLGIIIGYSYNNHKLLKSFIASFIAYIIFNLFTLVFLYLLALGNSEIMNIFHTTQIVDAAILKNTLLFAIILYIIYIIICYIVSRRLFQKGVNIE